METASILLQDVWVEYPIYGARSRSLKNKLFSLASGGRIPTEPPTRVQALKEINLEFSEGDRVGLVGRNGAGKTTLLRVLAGSMCPARGRVRRVGVTSTLFNIYSGMNGEVTGWDNIMLCGLFLGLTPAELRARTDEIAKFSGLTSDQLARPVHTYSTGMSLRLAFSVATCLNPEVLLMDEWIWVGDAGFVEQAQKRLHKMIDESRILVIATHADYLIQHLCNKVIYLQDGEVVATGPVDDVLALYHAQKNDQAG